MTDKSGNKYLPVNIQSELVKLVGENINIVESFKNDNITTYFSWGTYIYVNNWEKIRWYNLINTKQTTDNNQYNNEIILDVLDNNIGIINNILDSIITKTNNINKIYEISIYIDESLSGTNTLGWAIWQESKIALNPDNFTIDTNNPKKFLKNCP